MSYIGSTPTTQSFIAGTDSFNGTGSATSFTLTRLVNSTNDIQVVVNNVVQYPPNYSVSGNTLTISPAPSSGTNNVYVRYLSTTLQTITPSQGTVTPTSLSTGGPAWDVNGNFGVGTTSPSTFGKFAVYKPASDSRAVIVADNNTAYDPTLAFLQTGVTVWNLGIDQSDSSKFKISNSGTYDISSGNRFAIDGSGNLQFNSGYGSVATAYGCRAWVNFNGTGTVAIRASGNVSSITDNGTGDYTVNFTTAMPDANYQYSGTGKRNSATHRPVVISQANTATYDSITTSFRFLTWVEAAAAVEDPLAFNVTVFR
jgi:hypothetical protein